MTSEEKVVLALPRSLSIETVEPVAEEMKEKLAQGSGSVVLDASLLEGITTPGIQLILGVHKSVAASGGQFSISGAGESLCRTFRELGLEPLLNQLSGDNGNLS